MTSIVCVGAQWGDEGKGKVVDTLAKDANMVVRYNGGNNAGHTLVIEEKKVILHLVPTGAMWEHTVNVIGNGVLVDPLVLAQEIELLQGLGRLKDRRSLVVSPLCHIITEKHKEADNYQELNRATKLGTTKRGVGPCYQDKVSRFGKRMAEFISDTDGAAEYQQAREIIAPYVRDPAKQIAHFCKDPKARVLFEGAQGTMLDIDYGTYPFVTSSHTVGSYAPVGSGVSHSLVGPVLGIAKAYVTRVGTGPFPTELPAKQDGLLRDRGGEYGATTGRPRKCGWLDLVALKRAVEIDNIQKLAITKLDVLGGFGTLKACVGYELNGQELSAMPTTSEEWSRVTPKYTEFPGFEELEDDIDDFDRLPSGAKEYLNFISEYLEAEVSIVGIGAQRGQEIFVSDVWR